MGGADSPAPPEGATDLLFSKLYPGFIGWRGSGNREKRMLPRIQMIDLAAQGSQLAAESRRGTEE
jgi:hypothetical protein